MALTAGLVFNANAVQAEDLKPNTLTVIETTVVKVSAVKAEGIFISIPRAALISRNGIPGVFVVENNEARFRMVRPGKTGVDTVEILSGLFGHEELVMSHLDAMHDGSPLNISIKKSTDK